jgi:hypothetical protein
MLQRRLTFFAAGALAFAAMGCFKHSYTTGSGGDTSQDARYSKWHSHWLFGIIGEEDVNVRQVCTSGNATVKDEVSFVNGVIGALVGAIYYPTTVDVYCDGSSRAAQVVLSPDQMKRIGTNPELGDFARALSEEKAHELSVALARTRQADTQ